MVAATGPAGIILGSEDSITLGAQQKIDIVSAGDAEVSAGRSLFLRASRALSMFAYELGLRLIAGRGDVVVQTHKGDIEIKSSGRISLIAAGGIEFDAPSIKIAAQGAQTNWDAGTITHQSTGEHLVKASAIRRGTGTAGAPTNLHLPTTELETDERVIVFDRQTGMPAKGRRYIARHEDGTTIEGITDDEGRTDVLHTYSIGDIEIRLLPDDDTAPPGAGQA